MKRLAIVTTHPIQYYAPVFALLHLREKIGIKVFYTWGKAGMDKFDPGFQKNVSWDISTLDDYPFDWVVNTSKEPGSHHFNGIINSGLIEQITQYTPDAILFFGWAYQSHLKAMRFFKNKVPVYFRGDSTLLDQQNGLKTLFRSVFLKWLYRHIDIAFYTGSNNKAYFKKFGLSDEQLVFAPHAIDNKRFGEDRSNEAIALREKLTLNDEDILIVFVGKFEEKKGPLLLLSAFLQLDQSNCHLLFVGSGDLEGALKDGAKNSAHVYFMDFQNQTYIPVIYQAADLFCLPSNGPGESWGLAVNEAMACKKAVLVSDKVGCAVDLVKQDFNGAIFGSGNINSLVTALSALVHSKKTLQVYGNNSAAIIKDWGFEKIAVAIEKQLAG